MGSDDDKELMEAPPKGTFAVMFIYGAIALALWLFFYFGIFLSRGPVN
ncbi:MAG: hypothetical protein H6981_13140 [Gammaproteobacteria bacterium]|nr:hypothetical protein [Gammaproteobacteria bacterium]MCP5137734.1 hypothetical protein [Gammaproteobacteria bacterium]